MAEFLTSNGYRVLVDDDDLELVSRHKWGAYVVRSDQPNLRYVTTTEYLGKVDGKLKRRTTYLHRLIMNAPRGVTVDHDNLNTLDNRRSNLRLANTSQQGGNQSKRRNNTSGFKGVYWHKKKQRWRSRITVKDRKSTRLNSSH